MFDAFFTSTIAVAIAEIGDKTQLLSLLLAARYRRPAPIILGILVATLANHTVAAALGLWLAELVPATMLQIAVGVSFIAMAAWALIPDKIDPDTTKRVPDFGAFIATLMLFFLVEIGDKTQIATVALAARFHSIFAVTLGTTLGMMIANIPVVIFGEAITRRLPLSVIRWITAGLFVIFGVVILLAEL